MLLSLPARILDKISPEPNTGCWLWTAGERGGYGRVRWRDAAGRNVNSPAHRVVYELLKAPIPSGLDIDHRCRNTYCVNPDHLEPVTPRENTLRGFGPSSLNAKKTECPKGHPLSGDNLYVKPDGRRVCRTCKSAEQQSRRKPWPLMTTCKRYGHPRMKNQRCPECHRMEARERYRQSKAPAA